jgi:hypothetical protein
MRFVAHHIALVHSAESDALSDGMLELMAPSSSRSHILSRLREAVQRGKSDEEVARNA